MNKALLRTTLAALVCSAAACQPSGDAPSEPEIVLSAESARIPRITSVNPPLASNIGGTTLTITGTSFEPGAEVFIGGQRAAFSQVFSSTQIQTTSASKSLPTGPVTIKVVNPSGRQSERSDVLSLFNDSLSLVAIRGALGNLFGSSSQLIAVADLNGDGLQDLIRQDYSGIKVFLCRGRNDYSEGQTLFLSSSGPYPGNVGDFNGDGKLDIVVGTSGSGSQISISLGKGDGTFSDPETKSLPGLFYGSVTVTDLNGDGRSDLLIINGFGVMGSGYLSYLTQADGSFIAGPVSSSVRNLNINQLVDVNGDGKVDLLGADTFGSTVYFQAGSGDGAFDILGGTQTLVDGASIKLVFGDFNGDGKPDMASLAEGGKLSIRTGLGNGAFSGTTLVAVDPNVRTLAQGDVTADGKLDLVVGSPASLSGGGATVPGSGWLLTGKGDGTFQAPRSLSLTPLDGADELRVTDVDKDGKQDVVATSNASGFTTVIYSRGNGNFVEDAQLPVMATALGHADLNGDGKVDVVAVSVSNNKLYVLLGNGDGTTAAPRVFDTDRAPSGVVIAEVTGDTKADLLVSNYDAATVSLLPGNGDGTFSPQRTFSVGKGPNGLVAVDMNGDGRLDIVTTNYEANSVSVLLNNGTGNFSAAKNFSTGTGPAALAAGDFNGDGRTDVVTANADANTVSYLQGSATTAGSLNAAKSLATGKGPSTIVAREVTGDGKLDLITGNADGGDLSLLSGKGDGTFNAIKGLGQVGQISELLLADMSGDGRPDLVVSGGLPARVTVLYGFAGGVFVPSSRSLSVGGPLAAPDLNGDGKPDLLVGQQNGALLLHLNVSK